jgi:Calcineurin-like phosphoesterase
MRVVPSLPHARRTVAATMTVVLILASGLIHAGANAADDPILVGAGDIADCSAVADEATAQLLDGIPGTVFTLGDNVYRSGTAAEFRDCYDPTWGRHLERTRPALGNHDYKSPGADPYFDYFGAAAGPAGRGWYSYDLGTWHIVVLDSNCAATGGCDEGSAQLAWLKTDLAAHPDANVLAYWHHPRFSSGMHGPSLDPQPFWEVLYEAGAEIVLNGHDHDYERFAPQDPWGRPDPEHGIRAFVVGTGGTALRPRATVADNSQAFSTTYGVLKLTLHTDGYDWQFVAAGGGTFSDAGSGDTHGPPPSLTRMAVALHADTWVDQGARHTSHATSPKLRIDGNHGGGLDYRTYVKVKVAGLTGIVHRAAIRLWVVNPTRDGPAVRQTATSWKARTLTWANRPKSIGPWLSDVGPVPSGGWVDFDVTSAISGDGTYSFLLRSTSSDGLVASSLEGAHPPMLIIETDAAP